MRVTRPRIRPPWPAWPIANPASGWARGWTGAAIWPTCLPSWRATPPATARGKRSRSGWSAALNWAASVSRRGPSCAGRTRSMCSTTTAWSRPLGLPGQWGPEHRAGRAPGLPAGTPSNHLRGPGCDPPGLVDQEQPAGGPLDAAHVAGRLSLSVLKGIRLVQRILLIEDHPRLASLIKRALAQAGVECDVLERIDQGWAALQSQAYSAALVDRGLPDGDGLSLIRRWRDSGQQLPCLILTARDALHDRIAGLEGGADDYLTKPFSVEELVARTRALLRRAPEQTTLEPRFADLQVQPHKALLVCQQQSVLLPRTELQIMLTLIKGAGDPIRRSALEAAAWGLQEAVTPNALDVALHRLRKKIQTLGSSVKIQNLRGVGYALEAL